MCSSKRDEVKLNNLFAKTNMSASRKQKAISQIIKDIYGCQQGNIYEYGLAEADDQDDFEGKLNSLKDRWNVLCPGFYDWFHAKRKQTFIESVIQSAREGTNITGLFYQNDIESMHPVEKRQQKFQKVSISELLSNIESIIKREEIDEVRALYGAGNYHLASEYEKFKIASHTWHSWSIERISEHIDKFRNYTPTIDDTFQKPSAAGRKPGYQRRESRNKVIDMVIDRVDEVLENEDEIPDLNISFSDPRQQKKKEFELHFRSNLPKSIARCQGKCGKPINKDEILVVRSYGTAYWTDKKTGKERQKYGPMYIHFADQCLKNFDDEEYYTSGEGFKYQKVTADKATKESMRDADKEFLIRLGVNGL